MGLHHFHAATGRGQEDGAVVEAHPFEQPAEIRSSILIVHSDPVTAARLGPMADDPGSFRRFLKTVIRPAIYGRRTPLEVSAHHLHDEPIPAIEAVRRPFTPFEVGDTWGGTWGTTWFRFRGSIPKSWAGAEVVALIHLGGDQMVGFTAEGQIWDTGLQPVQGLHHQHREFVLTPEAQGDQPIEFFVEAAANPIPPWHLADWPLLLPDYSGAPLYTLETAELAVPDRSVEGLLLDMRILAELAALHLDRSEQIMTGLDKARSIIDPENVSAWVVPARAVLAPLLDRTTSSANTVVAVGHAHIDCAWLWPLRETRRKCARTFSNQLRLLERYPEYHFACSQAVQYQWMKDGYPDLYEQIVEQVRSERWEPVGGMWVEPDTNIPSGESLVRQLVYGKRFFAEEFGVETHELWIPDVFGYSAALPQIAREAGVTSFITQKMSWNDTNPFPHTSFWWEGHDGSRLLAHFPRPTRTTATSPWVRWPPVRTGPWVPMVPPSTSTPSATATAGVARTTPWSSASAEWPISMACLVRRSAPSRVSSIGWGSRPTTSPSGSVSSTSRPIGPH